ncbi:TonB-dependent hemoglobin/transferrin/lactoferrin family receptor [Shinella sp.]|uniref:TonB-dependent receptor n=2 Tax=Shinella sp. TaxID=1870904 RepID=UPI0028B141DB|nr:TonB-dependent hemoglobin/transferrin/lactoferrin family receptor [Shinella sp.]
MHTKYPVTPIAKGNGTGRARTIFLATTALALMCTCAPALGQDIQPKESESETSSTETARIAFNLPAQTLANAVGAFGRQSGLQVTLSSTQAGNIRTNAVIGRFTPSQALSRMLAGTGIHGRVSGNSAILSSDDQTSDLGATDGSTVLETINVGKGPRSAASGAGFQGTPDWVYETPASVSVISRTAIEKKQPRNAYDLFSGVSGVSVAGAAQNPGVAINVRGLQDQTRVTTTIDGARQNFQQAGHGYTSNVYVDPALVRAVEVDKNAGAGVGSGGSHGGVVGFRTLTADDVLLEGRDAGGWIDATKGTNAYEFYGSAALAARTDDGIDIVAALSRKNLDAYEIGKNGTLESNPGGDKPVFTGSDTTSGLIKAGLDLENDQRIEFGFVGYDARFTTSTALATNENTNHVRNLTGTLTYTYKPDDPLFDLKGQLWWNRTENHQWRSARNGSGAFDLDYGLSTYGFNIENTSTFALATGDLSLHYGTELFLDRAETEAAARNPTDATNTWWFTGPNPTGDRWLSSTFATAKYEHQEWLEASIGGRYDYYKITGSSLVNGGSELVIVQEAYCAQYHPLNPTRCIRRIPAVYAQRDIIHNISIDKSAGRFSPEALIALKPQDGIQVFGKYSEGFRPGTLGEMLLGGVHVGGIPISNAPNANLQPETSKTWEVGVNLSGDDLLAAGDSVRFKAAYFDKTIDNYIALGSVTGSPVTGGQIDSFYAYTNLLGESRLRGVEIEGNYDAGPYYFGGTFTYTKGDFSKVYNDNPWDNATSTGNGTVLYVSVAPKYRFTADVGMRFFDDKLNVGARANRVVPSEQLGLFSTVYKAKPFTTFDIYGSWEFNENASLRFAVNNLTDVAYVDPMNSSDFPAPGRTATLSLKVRF